MCVEQVQKKKKLKNILPHEKKIKGYINTMFLHKKIINYEEREFFTEYLVLYLDSLDKKTY